MTTAQIVPQSDPNGSDCDSKFTEDGVDQENVNKIKFLKGVVGDGLKTSAW